MRAIFINSEARTVDYIDYDGSLECLQKAVGGSIELAVQFPNGDVLYVNEEGLLIPLEHWFMIRGGHQPFAGNGIIVGTDGPNDSLSAKTQLSAVRNAVAFVVPSMF